MDFHFSFLKHYWGENIKKTTQFVEEMCPSTEGVKPDSFTCKKKLVLMLWEAVPKVERWSDQPNPHTILHHHWPSPASSTSITCSLDVNFLHSENFAGDSSYHHRMTPRQPQRTSLIPLLLYALSHTTTPWRLQNSWFPKLVVKMCPSTEWIKT